MKIQYNKTIQEIEKQIKECEGKHVQQVVYSTYHKSLTQICFGCDMVRTQMSLNETLK